MKAFLDFLLDVLIYIAETILFFIWLVTFPIYFITISIIDNLKRKWLK